MDVQTATVSPFLSGYAPSTADLRERGSACQYLKKTGCPRRDLPRHLGLWETALMQRGQFARNCPHRRPQIRPRLARTVRHLKLSKAIVLVYRSVHRSAEIEAAKVEIMDGEARCVAVFSEYAP